MGISPASPNHMVSRGRFVVDRDSCPHAHCPRFVACTTGIGGYCPTPPAKPTPLAWARHLPVHIQNSIESLPKISTATVACRLSLSGSKKLVSQKTSIVWKRHNPKSCVVSIICPKKEKTHSLKNLLHARSKTSSASISAYRFVALLTAVKCPPCLTLSLS